MYKNKFKALIVALCLLGGGSAFAQREVGNGGDIRALEFVRIGHEILFRLSNHYPINLPKINLNQLKEVMDNTTVESTNEFLSLDRVPKDAINNPTQHKIIFNRAQWDALLDYRKKMAFVLHEYIGIMNDQDIDDSNYQISNIFLALEPEPRKKLAYLSMQVDTRVQYLFIETNKWFPKNDLVCFNLATLDREISELWDYYLNNRFSIGADDKNISGFVGDILEGHYPLREFCGETPSLAATEHLPRGDYKRLNTHLSDIQKNAIELRKVLGFEDQTELFDLLMPIQDLKDIAQEIVDAVKRKQVVQEEDVDIRACPKIEEEK
ncbi:MAG: hypothetical protein A3B70_05075 [Deltaproteobacteria bacterium RIFCSPHIGHO2_02_FULL_40_11]|nr:MAG: hypothetical protein A3B70_05075 [Deltaproteobacteria bacterium RIFCSPHIGHO2_02_FULL_40_11]